MSYKDNQKLQELLVRKIKDACESSFLFLVNAEKVKSLNNEKDLRNLMDAFLSRVNTTVIYSLASISPKVLQNIKKILEDKMDPNLIPDQLVIDAGALLNLCHLAMTGKACDSEEKSELRTFQFDLVQKLIAIKRQELSDSIGNKPSVREMSQLVSIAKETVIPLPSTSEFKECLIWGKEKRVAVDRTLSSFLDSVFADSIEFMNNNMAMALFHIPAEEGLEKMLKPHFIVAGMCAILYFACIRDCRIGDWFINNSSPYEDYLIPVYDSIHKLSYELSNKLLLSLGSITLFDIVDIVSYKVAIHSPASNMNEVEAFKTAICDFYFEKLYVFYDEEIFSKVK